MKPEKTQKIYIINKTKFDKKNEHNSDWSSFVLPNSALSQ